MSLSTKDSGPDVGGIKGKTTRSWPTQVVINIVEILDEFLKLQQDLTLSMDGFTVHSLKFLSTISHLYIYRTSKFVAKSVVFVYENFIDELLAVYKRGVFNITDIN